MPPVTSSKRENHYKTLNSREGENRTTTRHSVLPFPAIIYKIHHHNWYFRIFLARSNVYLYRVKHPTAKAGGFYAVPRTEHTRHGLRGPLPGPFVRWQSQVKLVGIAPSSIGTLNIWYVTAFTQGNDLPWNAQTVLSCPCAVDACPGVEPYGLMASGTLTVYHMLWYTVKYEQETNQYSLERRSTIFDCPTVNTIGHQSISSHRDGYSSSGKARGDSPYPHHAPKGTALSSPWLKPGVFRAGSIN